MPQTGDREMRDLLEACYSAQTDEPRRAFRKLVTALKSLPPSQAEEATGILRQMVLPDLDYATAMTLVRLQKELRRGAAATLKLAILGSFTTHQLADLVALYLFALGIDAKIYESDYDVSHQEIADSSSQLYEFRPDVLFLATARRSLAHLPDYQDSPQRVRELVDEEVGRWSNLWNTAQERLGCQILQNNFDIPPGRILGNHEMRHHAGQARYLTLLNLALQDAAPPFVTIHDVDSLSAAAGRWEWADEQFYYHAKMPCAPEFLVGYAHSVASVIGAHRGKSKKALVLDLDNTLWGGVIGDDGIGGIRLGQGDAEGEAFLAFQQYADSLRRRGVILAVCSKNDEKVAREVFEKHPEMCLRSEHISCFVANWDDKATNLRRIAEQLEIGIDSLVFVDDNPAERAIVRRFLPQVAVPELPEDPAGYIRAVERHAYFQTVSVGTEDLQRTEMYHANSLRQQAQSTVANIDEFLASLEMKARVEEVTATTLERVAQLIARSNQFNLTTRRHSAADLMAMARSGDWLTRTVSLKDCFGDNGLISVLLARIAGEEMIVDTWLMSCRVLKRGVERFLLNTLCETARERKIQSILGEYIPTKKNGLVRDHYAHLGFETVSSEPDGHAWWRLSPSAATPFPTFISREPSND
jgi:FkbH-like protein